MYNGDRYLNKLGRSRMNCSEGKIDRMRKMKNFSEINDIRDGKKNRSRRS
jgi:hypothetical protein